MQLLAHNTQTLPEHDTELEMLDYAVASMAVQTAVMRHAGTLEETYTMLGQTFVQSGKDLSEVRRVVVTAGASSIRSGRGRSRALPAATRLRLRRSVRKRRISFWTNVIFWRRWACLRRASRRSRSKS